MTFYKFFKIQDKHGRSIPFFPKKAQKHFHEELKKHNRIIVLKARQMGFSTFLQLYFLDYIMSHRDKKCIMIAHYMEQASEIFKKIKYSFKNLHQDLQKFYEVKYDSARELYFGSIDSSIAVTTSGRSATFQKAHISEYAFFESRLVQETMTGTLQAIGKDQQLIIETTANGLNHFFRLWTEAKRGENDFVPLFYNWTWEDDYRVSVPQDLDLKGEYLKIADELKLYPDIQERFGLDDEQLYWYFLKAREIKDKVKQEYPIDDLECFLASGKSWIPLTQIANIQTKKPIRTPFVVIEKLTDSTRPPSQTTFFVDLFAKPTEKHRYTIGIDTASGNGLDSSTIEVVDIDTNEEVASFYSKGIKPTELSDLAVEIANYYNRGLIIPENNGVGMAVTERLRFIYGNLFIDERSVSINGGLSSNVGFATTSSSRPQLLAKFKEEFEKNNFKINSEIVKKQLQTFIVKENGKIEHEDGEHDDSLFALFLASYGREKVYKVFIV